MSLKTTVLMAAVVAVSVQVATAATTGDSISLVPSFVGATTTSGTTISGIPTFTSGNTLYVYTSGAPGIYTINYTLSANLTSGGFGSVAFSTLTSSGLSLPTSGASYIPDTTGPWYSVPGADNQNIVINGDFGSNTTDLQNVVASYGPVPNSPQILTQPVGEIRVAWDGSTTATVKLGDTFDSTIGQIAYQTNSSDGVMGDQQFAVDPWTVQFVGTPLVGDADYSGTVDFSDLTALLRHYNQADSNWSDGDFVGDPTIDFNDLTALLRNYSLNWTSGLSPSVRSSASLAIGAAPEPSSLIMLGAGISAFLMARRKRKQVPAVG